MPSPGHNYNGGDRLKACQCESERKPPFPSLFQVRQADPRALRAERGGFVKYVVGLSSVQRFFKDFCNSNKTKWTKVLSIPD
jgi:hypothetical protein